MSLRRSALAILLALTAGAAPAATAPTPEANQAFLAANAKKPGVVTMPSGLQYRALQTGFGQRPGLTDAARIQYSAKLIDGTLVDGSSPGLPATVAVNGVIRGLSEALQMMHVGDLWQVVMPSALAHSVRVGGIPPSQVLVFDISLMAVMPTPPGGVEQSDTLSILSADREHAAVLTIHP